MLGVSKSSIHIIGVSLGAHVGGVVGYFYEGQLGRITGNIILCPSSQVWRYGENALEIPLLRQAEGSLFLGLTHLFPLKFIYCGPLHKTVLCCHCVISNVSIKSHVFLSEPQLLLLQN